VHFQFALFQSFRDRREQALRLRLALAVGYRIICETGEWTLRVLPLHPSIESEMHVQVHQHRLEDRSRFSLQSPNGRAAKLPTSARATPLVFTTQRGRQMVAIAAGGDGSPRDRIETKLVVFALTPKSIRCEKRAASSQAPAPVQLYRSTDPKAPDGQSRSRGTR
jgi:hypothetical protein